MKRAAILLTLLVLVVSPAPAARSRVALPDFAVIADDPEYRQVGKGFAVVVAAELQKARGIAVVDRSKCLRALAKGSLSVSDLGNSALRMRGLCRELKADFLILGSISGLGDEVVFGLRLIQGSSGEEMAATELTSDLSDYEFVSASLTEWVAVRLLARVTGSTTDKAKTKRGGNGEALMAFSLAVDYYDRKDQVRADQALLRAVQIDPECEAMETYRRRMAEAQGIRSLKYSVEPAFHAFASNPADLGFIDHDSLHFGLVADFEPPGATVTEQGQLVEGYYVRDENDPQSWQYVLPLGRALGLGAQFIMGGYDRYLSAPFWFDHQGTPVQSLGGGPQADIGGAVALGYRFREDMSLGGSVAVWSSEAGEEEWNYLVDAGTYYSLELAYLFRKPEDRLTVGVAAVYTNQHERYVDFSELTVEDGSLPLLLEASIVSALPGKTLFLSFTGRSEIYIDGRGGHVLAAFPLVEYRPLRRLSLRAGGEYSHMLQAEEFVVGYGALLGVSVKFGRIELDGNLRMREKPPRLLPGHTISELCLGIGATVDLSLLRRQSL